MTLFFYFDQIDRIRCDLSCYGNTRAKIVKTSVGLTKIAIAA
jgi:hypothetical protein